MLHLITNITFAYAVSDTDSVQGNCIVRDKPYRTAVPSTARLGVHVHKELLLAQFEEPQNTGFHKYAFIVMSLLGTFCNIVYGNA